jgi:signal transduction histidine kinase
MLALLLAVVVVGIGCVLWFMNEAMRNERVAARERLAEAYRGQLALVQKHVEDQWQAWRMQLDHPDPNATDFARLVQAGRADSVICFGPDGRVVYPQEGSLTVDSNTAAAGDALQEKLRALVKTNDTDAAIQFTLEKFGAKNGSLLNTHGRLVAPNAELLALELLTGKSDPRFDSIAARLRARLLDYASPNFPAAQRVFVMRELQRLSPGQTFPTLAAEELAAQFLAAHPKPVRDEELRPTDLRDVWSVASPTRRIMALLTTSSLHSRLAEIIREPSLPSGVRVTAMAPGDDPNAEGALVTSALGPSLPGWRVALILDDQARLATTANERVSRYLLIGSVVIAAMILLAIATGRKLGRQVHLARLKNDLVANVSHELKTPLTSMRALVDTLLDAKHFDEHQTREYLQLMAAENARLSRMIDNFLTFSRLERNKFTFDFTPLHPSTIVDEAVTALGSRAHAPSCTLSVQIAPGLPEVRGDSDALVMALLNLLDNAWKYTGDEKQIFLRADAQNGTVRFAVTDNGVGLTPAESRAVFDRFHQVDNRLSRATSGCGLGLSIVRSIVLAHDGEVQVESESGRGSTFTMMIPALERRAE